MELKKEDSQPDLSTSKMNLANFDLVENLQKIKPESQLLEEKFERLDQELKLRSGNKSLEGSIWAPKADRCEKKESISTKILSANIIGKNAFEREKTLR